MRIILIKSGHNILFLFAGAAPEPRLVGQETGQRQAAHDRARQGDEAEAESAPAQNEDPHSAQSRPRGRQVQQITN